MSLVNHIEREKNKVIRFEFYKDDEFELNELN